MKNNLNYRKNVIKTYDLKNLDYCLQNIKYFKSIENEYEWSKGLFKTNLEKCNGIVMIKYKKKFKSLYSKSKKLWKTMVYNLLSNKMKINNMINDNICPHFSYTYYPILNDTFNIKHVKHDIFVINEGVNTKLTNFFRENHSVDSYHSILFQILITLICSRKYLNDNLINIEPKQFSYIRINSDYVFNYNINDVNYYVPIHGYLIIYSMSYNNYSEHENNNKKNINLQYDDYHYYKLSELHYLPIKISLELYNIYGDKNMLPELKKYVSKQNYNIIKTYYNDKIVKVKEHLITTKKYTTNHPLYYQELYAIMLKQIIEFIITAELVDLSELISEEIIQLSKNIRKFTIKIFNSNKPIDHILNKYFNHYKKHRDSIKTFIIDI